MVSPNHGNGNVSPSADSNKGAGQKRKATEDATSPIDEENGTKAHTRSKRSRYISIACNECKRRKIKCNGQTPCQRCGNLQLDCVYSPNCCTNTLRDSQEFKQMQDHISKLQEQVADLYNTVNDLRSQSNAIPQHSEQLYPMLDRRTSLSSRTLPPLISPRARQPAKPLPTFHGPTSSVYGLDVAKSSLSHMGIMQPPDIEGLASRERSQAASPVQLAPHPNKDPIWLLTQDDARRLVKLYEEECHMMYPCVELDRLYEHIQSLYTFVNAALRTGLGQPGLPGEDTLDDESTILLKMVLAIALVIDGTGQSELGQRMYDSARKAVDLVIVGPLTLKAVVLLVLTATYHFQKDEEAQAWRFIGIAGRMCIGMGLHRRDSLLRSFKAHELDHAVLVFWTVYALDRRWSFGTGMPFSLQDSDIDRDLPKPDNTWPYLKHITDHNHIATKIWQHISSSENGGVIRKDEIGYLDFQILQWYNSIPDDLKFDSNNLNKESKVLDRKLKRLRFLMFLRKNQARISVYRPILHSVTSIMENRQGADTVIQVAKETIKSIIGIDQLTDIYRTQQVCYNYFLVQALAVIFLSVAHAPAVFCDSTREEFYGAIDLIKGFSTKSHTTRRVWKTVRGLKELGHKIGQLARGEVPTVVNDDTNAAMAMAGLAGHQMDMSTNGFDMSYSPEDANQMGNELTALFEMAGAQHGMGNGQMSMEFGGFAVGEDDDGDATTFNAWLGNEPELSRIVGDLL